MRPTPDWPIRDLLSHRARTTPEATAVVDASDGRTVSYGDLTDRVDALAASFADELSAHASPASDGRPRAVLAASTTIPFVVGLFATWRAGAVAVPVEADTPAADLERRLDRLAPALVIGDLTADHDRPTRSVEEVDAVTEAAEGRHSDADEPISAAGENGWGPAEPALCLFTSGTTGGPKGVQLSHRNLVASAAGSAYRLGLDPADRWLDCLPPNHMGGLAPIVRATCYGTTVVLQDGFDAEAVADAMDTHEITGISLVPTQLRRLLDIGWTPLASLRFVLLGGAPAGPDLLADSAEAGVPVCPTYGSTETASQIATARPGEIDGPRDAVGHPLLVADVTIVDPEAGEAVDPGETGELVVDGPIVTPGYLDDDATEDAFGEYGLYTGDLASQDDAGRLTIHGRLDDAVQTGGETVHPSRVASELRMLSAVDDAAVLGLPDDEWGERVAALIVPADGAAIDLTTVREALRDELADYELPKTVGTAPSLPRTDSGTIDRSAVRSRLAEGDDA